MSRGVPPHQDTISTRLPSLQQVCIGACLLHPHTLARPGPEARRIDNFNDLSLLPLLTLLPFKVVPRMPTTFKETYFQRNYFKRDLLLKEGLD